MNSLRITYIIPFILVLSCSSPNKGATTNDHNSETEQMSNTTDQSVHSFTMPSLEGEDVPLSVYKGKVLVIVNTASKCGLTPQYKDIEAFYKSYKDRGVEVLGFPANNFLFQEPGSNEEIQQFCEKNYGVSFPMFSKISVKGKEIDPLYQYLTRKENNGVFDAPVQWNFQKFLVDKEGHVIKHFAPRTEVTDPEFIKEVENLIK